MSELTIEQKAKIIYDLKDKEWKETDYFQEIYKQTFKEITIKDENNFLDHMRMIYEVLNASYTVSLEKRFGFQKNMAIIICRICEQIEETLKRFVNKNMPFKKVIEESGYIDKFKELIETVDRNECALLYDLLIGKHGEGIIEKMKSEYTEPVHPLAQIMNQIFKFKSSEDKPEKVDSKDYLKQKLEELGISEEEFEKEKKKFK